MFMAVTTPASASASTDRLTVEKFQNHLEQVSKNDAKALEELEKFNRMSNIEKSKLIALLNDGELMNKVIKEASSDIINSPKEKSFHNGDIKITKTITSTLNGNQSYTKEISTYGLNLTSLTLTVYFKYDPSNSVVTETLSANNTHWNINPGLVITNEANDHFVNGTLAQAWGNYNFYVTASGGFFNYTVTLNIQCDNEDVSGWLES